ncbi:uncharacterized protein [Musca autumnalis]
MSNEQPQHSKGKLKYFSPPDNSKKQGNSKCQGCEELSKKVDLYKDATQKQYNTIVEILAEHKVLLDRIANLNAITSNMMSIFPINTEEKLKEFDTILSTQADPYKRQMKTLLAGNAERNLHLIFGHDIIMSYNVEGLFGKNRLRDFSNVYTAIIDVISTFSESADKTLRSAFQRQKKKFFKQTSRNKENQKHDDNSDNEN